MRRQNSNSTSLLRRLSGTSTSIITSFKSPFLGGAKKKCVERGILFVVIVAVIIAIFAPVGVLIDEFLNIQGGDGASFDYKESCSNNTEEMVVSSYINSYCM